MSRRDTIIVAVILNTGLLAILFMMAMTPGDSSIISEQPEMTRALAVQQDDEFPKHESVAVQQPAPLVLVQDNSSDEVDTVLKDFAATLQADALVRAEIPKKAPKEVVAMKMESPPPAREWQQEQKYVEVTVKDGDILGRIAQANGTTVGAIKKANNLEHDRLKIGQVIRVPIGIKKEAQKSKPVEVNLGYYIIQSGDNPWKIAKKFSVSVKELLRLNDLDEARARNLKPGDRIRVR